MTHTPPTAVPRQGTSDAARPPRRGRAAAACALLLAATNAGAQEAAAVPRDETIRQALDLVERSYLEPDRIAPPVMLAAALDALLRGVPGAASEPVETGLRVRLAGAESIDLPLLASDDPATALAEPFERLLALLDRARADGGTKLPDTRVARAALLNGALRTLDRFSGAYTGGSRTNLLSDFTGTATGVGVRIGRREDAVRVLEVFPGSGAAEAGVHADDVVRAVAGTSVDGLVVSEVSRLLRGDEGSTVEIRVDRAGEPRTLTITRRSYVKPSVAGHPESGSNGVVRIQHLSKNTPEQVIARLEELASVYRVRRVVLDLRGNTGGSMLAAAEIADLFVGKGVLLEALDRFDRPVEGLRDRVEATRRGWMRMPVAVLVDSATGSSAELLAAALAWHDRAILVGERTFGKNIVQKVHNFDGQDLSLKISSAYLKTAGRRLPDEGLEPDVWIGEPTSAEDTALRITPGSEPGEEPQDEPGDEEDPWVAIALRLLEAHGGPSRAAMVQAIRAAR